MKAKGINTAAAEIALASASTDLASISAFLENIEVSVSRAVTAEDPQQSWAEARLQYGTIKRTVRSAYTNLQIAVAALKVASNAAPAAADIEITTTSNRE